MLTEENFVEFKCPYCGGMVCYPSDAVGHARECPECQEALIVPEPGQAGRALPLPLMTERLVLRRFGPGDWKELWDMLADEEFQTHAEGFQLPGNDPQLREEHVLNWLDRDAQIRLTTPDQPFRLALQVKADSTLAGYLRLYFLGMDRLQADFALNVHRKFQRQGFGCEALQALLAFCFKSLRLHRVTASCSSDNAAARRLCQKAGLRQEAEFVKERLQDGVWRNTVWYAMLDEEYKG